MIGGPFLDPSAAVGGLVYALRLVAILLLVLGMAAFVGATFAQMLSLARQAL